ncbi:MAG: PaaI family thioesterase [Sandaracinaceae bacterium]|nr:PaaI family thioesterase [Sandaracinaceae bacterium]MCC6874563.1 PaaI family thioesterase [Sandaracinaceae bacterium]
MSALVDVVQEAREKRDPQLLMQVAPYASFLGLTASIEQGEVITTMRFADHLVGDSSIPALHGGTTGALLESAAIFTVLFSGETLVMPKTITLTIDYLRSGRARDTFAKGTIARQGRRIVNVRSIAWQDDPDKPIASAMVCFLV